jgi:hypothetical protein
MTRSGRTHTFVESPVRVAVAHVALVAAFAVLLASGSAAEVTGSTGGASPGGGDLVLVKTANLQTRGVLTIRMAGDYFESLDASGVLGESVPGEYTTVRLGASYGLTTWLEVCADIPARRAAWGESPSGARDVTGLDAPIVGVKLGVPTGSSVLRAALSGRVGLPFGDEMQIVGDLGDELHLGGSTRTDMEFAMLVTADLTERVPLRLHANVGWAFHRSEGWGRRFFPDYYPAQPEDGDPSDNDALLLRGAVEFPGRTVDLFTEFRGDITSDRDLIALKENPLTVTPGVRARFGAGWTATAAFSVGISGDDRSTPDFDPHDAYPDWAATLTVAYAWPVFAADTDGDGIPDFRDGCPRSAEDLDGYRDADGCPDPDNDSDGVPDGYDGRPLLMEDYDGFEDEDGVPDLDNDGDGIVDERDMCPNEREDLDGFEDEDGCPDD